MSVWRLILKEITHRKANFGMGLASVAVAVACVVGALTLLRATDLRTGQILAAKEAETDKKLQILQDEIRKAMLNLSFNVLILPKDQNLGDLYTEDYASKYMPESYVERLAKSKTLILQHLLPSLQQKIKWPEYKRTIILMGARDEVPILGSAKLKPLLDAVPPGTMAVGYELWQTLGLKVNDKVKLIGKEFTIGKCHEERGNKDDITVWINLAEAQELLEKPGQINAILALECRCLRPDVKVIREELGRILPDTQVILKMPEALARDLARDKTADEAKAMLEREKEGRTRLRGEREAFASVLVPLVLAGCVAWIALLMLANVRERRMEIGVLRAIGLRSRQIFFLFLSKAFLMGLVGAVLGFLAGFSVGAVLGVAVEKAPLGGANSLKLFDGALFAMVIVLAPLVACLASWVPATFAAQQDPAVVLREE